MPDPENPMTNLKYGDLDAFFTCLQDELLTDVRKMISRVGPSPIAHIYSGLHNSISKKKIPDDTEDQILMLMDMLALLGLVTSIRERADTEGVNLGNLSDWDNIPYNRGGNGQGT